MLTALVHRARTYGPGLLLLGAIALLATFLSTFLPPYLGSLFVAILLGLLIANLFRPSPTYFQAGVKLGLKKILKIAIILLGAGITFQEILAVGGRGLFVIITLILFVFLTTFLLGRLFRISLTRLLLIAVGVSICGNTAIAATAPLVEAEEDEIAMAVGIVTLFGVLSVLIYPFVGHFLELSDQIFGVWAGTAINDTSQVVAAGFIYSDEAGRVATTIKLTRNVMIVPVVLAVGYLYARSQEQQSEQPLSIRSIFPTFVLGFLALAALNSIGLFSDSLSAFLVDLSKFLILLALSGIGLSVDLRRLLKIGSRPFLVGFLVEALLAAVALGLILLVFAGAQS